MTRSRAIKREVSIVSSLPDRSISPETMSRYKQARVQEEDMYETDEVSLLSQDNTRGSMFPPMPTPRPTNANSFATTSFASSNGLLSSASTPMVVHNSPCFQRSSAPSVVEPGGLHTVGRGVKIFVDAIEQLREIGLNNVVQLPELVLVGDQSAGKSSLMGALAEIHLPKSGGTCTRCPAHIKTATAAQWSCKISLRQEYRYEAYNRPITERDVTKKNPFPGWYPQDLANTKEFKTIYEKSELEEVMKWAQIANLNYSKNYHNYVPGSTGFTRDESTESRFSPNVVVVEIRGPLLPPLSFYDLPGLFQTTPDPSERYLAKVVEFLAIKYIEHRNALIIFALPMSGDAATSKTSKVIGDHHATGRTIGVLTKADRLQISDDGDAQQFENILRGTEHIMGHGYFVTKQPAGSSFAEHDDFYHVRAREQEEDFFNHTAPWTSDWAEFRSNCGTRNLQYALSQKFAAMVATNIPSIEFSIRARSVEIDAELSKLPELPVENVLHHVLAHLSRFAFQMQSSLKGGSSHNTFQSEWRILCDQFREAIMEMKPMVGITHESDTIKPEVINLDGDGEEDDNSQFTDFEMLDATPTGTRRKHTDHEHSPGTERKKFKHLPSTPNARQGGVSQTHPNRVSAADSKRQGVNPFEHLHGYGKGMYSIGTIRDIISSHTVTGVPGVVDNEVYQELCLQAVTPWEKPVEIFLESTMQRLRAHAARILFATLGHWSQTQLFKASQKHVKDFFDVLELSQQEANARLFRLENYKLFTINHEAFEINRINALHELRTKRRHRRVMAIVDGEALTNPKLKDDPDARKKAAAKIDDARLGKDPFEAEVEVAAWVRGYYATAGLRFADSVCLSMNGELFRNAHESISMLLPKELGLQSGDTERRAKNLMEENANVAKQRENLYAEKAKLRMFNERLVQLARDQAQLAEEGNGGSSGGHECEA